MSPGAICRQDGQQAWEAIEKSEEKPSLLVMEWRIPAVPGPILIQRVRYLIPELPIIAVNNDLQPHDIPLLHEIPNHSNLDLEISHTL